MSAHVPTTMEFGSARLISPDGSDQIPAALWPELELLILAEPEPADLADWARSIEDRLGVHDAHRIAIEQGQEAALAYIRDAKRRARLDQNQTASRQKLRDPEMAAKVDAKLDELAQAMNAVPPQVVGESKAVRKSRKSAEALVRKLQDELADLQAQERARLQLYGDAAEQIIRAKLRGEDVGAFMSETADFARDEHGAIMRHKRGPSRNMPHLVYDRSVRIRKLSGIKHAYAQGDLDGRNADQLKATGEQYGEAYEALDPLRAANLEGGGSGGGSGAKGPQIKIIEAGEMLDIMREHLSPRELRVLDMVCGQDMRVREAATAMGAGFPATVRALRNGLRTAGEAWALAREQKTVGRTAARVKGAHQMISRMRG